MTKQVPRILRADDFVAEAYEKWAANLPAPKKERARIISGLHKCSEKSGRTGTVRVWEEEKVEFVGAESLIGKTVRFRPDFCTTRIMPRPIGQAR
jgi:hypothetical protein